MLKIATSHEWARLEGNTVTVGITAYAVEQLGDIVYLDLPKVGAASRAGEAFGEIESVKAASELFAPVDGVITAVNSDLADDLDTLKKDATGAGWMIQIKAENPAQLDALMTQEQYDDYLKTL